jgi:uncharacterized protein (DUF1800 family)
MSTEKAYGGVSIARNQQAIHVLNRLAFGPRPGDIDEVNRIGAEAYIQRQLERDSIPEPPELQERLAALPTLRMTPVALFEEFQQPIRQARKGDQSAKKEARHEAKVVLMEAVQARIIRALYGPRQLQEVMAAFWFNHFNIFAGKGLCSIWTGAFEEEAIRPHTIGRFRDLLGATAHHPAMLFYLDNWQNTAPNAPGNHGKFDGINENYAREVMELHTLGVNGGYSQQDVIALAHILTGWSIERGRAAAQAMAKPHAPREQRPRDFAGLFPGLLGFRRFQRGNGGWQRPGQNQPRGDQGRMRNVAGQDGFMFYGGRHDFDDKTFLNRTIEGTGIGEGEEALDMLARSPATASHLSYKLAQYFVADDPPPALVKLMTARYLETDGNIRDVLEAMLRSDEFWDRRYYGSKFKTPYEYAISAARATGVEVLNVNPLAGTMAALGMPLYGCQTPDGYKNTRDAWLNPDSMMLRLSFATALGKGHLQLEHPIDADPSRPLAPAVRTAAFTAEGSPAPEPTQLALTVGDLFSPRTAVVIESAPPALRAPLILGSPEFMMR